MASGISASELCGSPALYLQKMDMARDMLFVVRMDGAAYRSASFLDDRILPDLSNLGWISHAPLENVARGVNPRPLQFIFHAGHAGSTLLSRLLDEAQGVLGLREPLPLRSLAEGHDAIGEPGAWSEADFERRLRTHLRLWSRGFTDTRMVIVKATSSAARIAPLLMTALPAAKAVYLNLRAESYICTLLAGPETMAEMQVFAAERFFRLSRLLGAPAAERALTPGEVAAGAWLVERLTQELAQAAGGNRLMALDFEDMLKDIDTALTDVLAHFALPSENIAAVATSPMLTRYSKLPDSHPYSADLRARKLDEARRKQGDEIRLGLNFLTALAARHSTVAAVMDI
jgi:hypothetical protein